MVIAAQPVRSRSERVVAALRHADLTLLLLPIALSLFGLVMIYASSRSRLGRNGQSGLAFVGRQSAAIVLGLGIMAVVMAIDYRRIRDLWPVPYALTLPLLLAVLVVGQSSRGAQAWYQVGPLQFQPSEVAKIVVIVAVAGYCHQHRDDLDVWRLAVAGGLAGAVMVAVFLQRDLGTMLVIMVCALAGLVVAGLKPVHIVVLLCCAATLVGAAVVTGRVQAYQLDRLRTFANQSAEASASGEQTPTEYNLKASKTAIASGGLTGAGLFQGLQTKNGFVPEQHTDFIFTAVGEDLGFLGGATLLALYGLLVWRLWRIALVSPDFFGTLVAVGVLAMFAIQVFENVGMTMGIMPITGIPLPFLSYGGSAIIGAFLAVGLVQSVHMRRFG